MLLLLLFILLRPLTQLSSHFGLPSVSYLLNSNWKSKFPFSVVPRSQVPKNFQNLHLLYVAILLSQYSLFLVPAKSKLHVYPGKIINTVAGGDVVIECVESGSRQSNISWTKVSNSRTEHTVLASGEGFANLEFHPVHVSDGGEYFCQGKGVREKVVVSVQGNEFWSI